MTQRDFDPSLLIQSDPTFSAVTPAGDMSACFHTLREAANFLCAMANRRAFWASKEAREGKLTEPEWSAGQPHTCVAHKLTEHIWIVFPTLDAQHTWDTACKLGQFDAAQMVVIGTVVEL